MLKLIKKTTSQIFEKIILQKVGKCKKQLEKRRQDDNNS